MSGERERDQGAHFQRCCPVCLFGLSLLLPFDEGALPAHALEHGHGILYDLHLLVIASLAHQQASKVNR
jgi:hypothetical protein